MQFLFKVVNILVGAQRQLPMVSVLETIEILLLQCIDKLLGLVETVQKLWEFRSWHCLLDRLLTCPCWPRHGAVEVPQLQFIDWWSAHHF